MYLIKAHITVQLKQGAMLCFDYDTECHLMLYTCTCSKTCFDDRIIPSSRNTSL